MPKACLRIFLFLLFIASGRFTAAADAKDKAYSLGEGITENKYHIEIDTASHALSLHVTISGPGGGDYTFHMTKNAEDPERLSLGAADQQKLRTLLEPVRKEYISLTGTPATQGDVNEIDFINTVHTKYNNKTDIVRFTGAKPEGLLSMAWPYLVIALALGLVIGIVSIKYMKGALQGKNEDEGKEEKKQADDDIPGTKGDESGGAEEQDNEGHKAGPENNTGESINDQEARRQAAAQKPKGKSNPNAQLNKEIAARKEAEKQVERGLKSIAESEGELNKIMALKEELQQEIERLKSENAQAAAETQSLITYVEKARSSLILPFLQFTQSSAAGPDNPGATATLLRDVLVMAWQYMALINYLSDVHEGTRRMDDNDKYNLKLYDLQGSQLEMIRQPEYITINDMPAHMPALVRSIAALLQQYQVKDLHAAVAGILFSSQNR